MSAQGELLKLTGVGKTYPAAGAGADLQVLHDITLAVEPGDRVAIVGPSGSGKSTLLNLMGSLDHPTSGRVLLQGRDLGQADEKELSRIRNAEIGFVFQDHHLLPQCTLLENVLLPALAFNRSAVGHTPRARELLERAGLQDRLNHRPGQLSGGECQRVAVVRALVNRPALLLADEPTGALDAPTAESLAELLVALNREERVALVVVTHAMDLARRMARMYRLHEGVLVGTTPGDKQS